MVKFGFCWQQNHCQSICWHQDSLTTQGACRYKKMLLSSGFAFSCYEIIAPGLIGLYIVFFYFASGGGEAVESRLGPLGKSATNWPIVPAPGVCEDGEFGGMNGWGNRSTRRKPAPTPLCQPQSPLDQTRARTLSSAMESQPLTAWAMARPATCFVEVL
jgi:hypothetical protein